MIEVRVISGCRKTYRAGMGLNEKDVPIYLERTIASMLESDIPTNRISVYIDSLQNNYIGSRAPAALVVHSATYGVTKNCGADITEIVRSRIAGEAVFLSASNQFCGCDPAVGERKCLFLEFSVDGVRRSFQLPEGQVMVLTAAEWSLDTDYIRVVKEIAAVWKLPVIISTGGGLNTHLPEVLRHPPREEFLLVCEDDIEVDARIFEKTTQWLTGAASELTFGSLYNQFGNIGIVPVNEFYGSQAVIIRSSFIEKILACIKNYDAIPGSQPGWMDIIMSRIVGNGFGLPIFVHRPSLVRHIGQISKWLP